MTALFGSMIASPGSQSRNWLLGFAVSFLFCAACTVDFDATDDSNLFSCSSDDDCLADFECYQAVVGELGVCRSTGSSSGTNCFDRDQDGYLSGPGCAGNGPFDCNDDPDQDGGLINPGRDEECNGIDDDCDEDVDEDIAPKACSLQAGVCTGSVTTCVGGDWVVCAEAGLYGPNYRSVSQEDEPCDGLDNNCSGGYPENATSDEIDPHCGGGVGRCIPGSTPPSSCGSDTGTCQRGVRFCGDDGFLSACVAADLGAACDDDSECGDRGFCVTETLDYREDLLDDCSLGSEPACRQDVCRALTGSTACEDDDGCGEDEQCLYGFCQPEVIGNSNEACNGLDDDCNGRIDDGADCGQCPFNMVFLNVPGEVRGLCMDMYEASRPDATAESAGLNELYAVSRAGVMPWVNIASTDAADQACRGSAINERPTSEGGIPSHTPVKTLCEQRALTAACGENFPYGDAFIAGACNDNSNGAAIEPTASYSNCCTTAGVCDLAGNAGELVARPNQGEFGGSAEDGEAGVRCTFLQLPTGVPDPSLGFRCCTQPLD